MDNNIFVKAIGADVFDSCTCNSSIMVVLVGSKVAFSHMVFDISQNWGGLVWFISYVSYYVGHPDVHVLNIEKIMNFTYLRSYCSKMLKNAKKIHVSNIAK